MKLNRRGPNPARTAAMHFLNSQPVIAGPEASGYGD
jgi:hypothetical protein